MAELGFYSTCWTQRLKTQQWSERREFQSGRGELRQRIFVRSEPIGAFGVLTFLVLCFAVAGGGSSSSPISAGVVRLASLPLLWIGLWRLTVRPVSAQAIWPAAIAIGAVGLVLIQLIPLPPHIWTRLPGRQIAVEVYNAAGLALPSLPISLSPDRTWNVLLSLTPAIAMFVATLSQSASARRVFALGVVLIAIASIVLGMLQIAGGLDSPLRFYASTNRDAAVGFFANRNHQASLLVSAVPFVALLAVPPASDLEQNRMFRVVAALALGCVLVVGLGVTRSRAGVLLLAPAFVGGLLVTLGGRTVQSGGERDWRPVIALTCAVALGVALVSAFSLTPLADRFEGAISDDLRFRLTPLVAHAGLAYAPFGSGLGSFPAIYQTLERPEMVMHAYVNHVHNDYVELWLEASYAGVLLVVAFLVWWLSAVVGIVRRAAMDSALALAGAVTVALLMLHSAVDYPLRTPALATLFGLACGFMVSPGVVSPKFARREPAL
jgi:O-antigen ligase